MDIGAPTKVVRHHHAKVDERGNVIGLPSDIESIAPSLSCRVRNY